MAEPNAASEPQPSSAARGCGWIVLLFVLVTVGLGVCVAATGGSDSTDPLPRPKPTRVTYEARVEHCGVGLPSRPGATAVFAAGVVANTGEVAATYQVWVAMKDASGGLLDYQNAFTNRVEPGGEGAWDTPAAFQYAPLVARCEVACVSFVGRGIADGCQSYK